MSGLVPASTDPEERFYMAPLRFVHVLAPGWLEQSTADGVGLRQSYNTQDLLTWTDF